MSSDYSVPEPLTVPCAEAHGCKIHPWSARWSPARARCSCKSRPAPGDRRSRRRFLGFFAPEELPEIPFSSVPVECSLALLRTYQVLDKLPPDERIAFALRQLVEHLVGTQ